ncbi:MAG: threonine synthase [Prolixibacteraceae bacterium]|nr:threonine synthase [Prolixibacteraceae bacterium]
MKYYSTKKSVPEVGLKQAVTKGLADDNGLFMPERINKFDSSFFLNIENLSFQEISYLVAEKFFGDDIENDKLKEIVYETISFDCPVVNVKDNISSLELFHGPTLAFKDVGARFMARILGHFLEDNDQLVNVLVATSGDTGSAVANGFLGVKGIHVYVLYPKGKVSAIQESQFTTLGKNITAIEIDGSFDDCQRLVKSAFLDKNLNEKMVLTSANSINVARFLPQAFYYFNAFARTNDKQKQLVISVPSGNFGNLTAGLFAKRMGLPVYKFIAANNENDIVYNYLKTGEYKPRSSVQTLANAMDVGDPSNFVRILDLYNNDYKAISDDVVGFRYSDIQISEAIKRVYNKFNYLLDPHGACGFLSLEEYLDKDQVGIFLETAHPAKFTETVEGIIGKGNVQLPAKLAEFMKGQKQSVNLGLDFEGFKEFLLRQ